MSVTKVSDDKRRKVMADMGLLDVVARMQELIARVGPLDNLPDRARRFLCPETLRRVPSWSYWGIGVVLALAILGLSRDTGQHTRYALPHRTNPPLPAEYVTLARHLADDHKADPGQPDPEPDVAGTIAKFLNAASDLKGHHSTDPEIDSLCVEACEVLGEAARHAQRLDALPKPPGFGEMFAESFARGFLGDLLGLGRSYQEAQGRQDAVVSEVRQIMALQRRHDVARLMLPRIAARYGGPITAGGQPVQVDFDASWGPVGPEDWLTLVNRSNHDLHNCTIKVEVRGRDGEIARSVHFVPHWRVATAIYAKYSPGQEVLGEIVERHTVPRVDSVVVSLWANELSQESITYAYAGAEWDADVARYCKSMQVLASYRPFAEGVLWNTERGVLAQLQGVKFLASPRITIHFRRGASSLSWYWDFDRWDAGETKTLDTRGKLPWDPESYRVVVTFRDTKHSYQRAWPIR